MAQYLIYGKRTKSWQDRKTNKTYPSDTQFRAIDAYGKRVTKLKDAFSFATREDAQEYIDSHKPKEGVVFEIRKVKS